MVFCSNFSRLIEIFDEVFSNAVIVERHTDKYSGTSRADNRLENMCVFMSAFSDGQNMIPCEFETKIFKDNRGRENAIYMTVTLGNKIEDDVNGWIPFEESRVVASVVSPSNITISQLLQNVNTKNGDIFRHIPDSLLSEEQIAQKRQSQIADNNKIYGYAQDEQYAERAGQLVAEQAELKGYTKGEDGNYYKDGQMKSADAFTYDDNGGIIPLKSRFDDNNADPRYSVGETTFNPTIDLTDNLFRRHTQKDVLIDRVAKALNIDIKFSDLPDGINGKYENGVLTISTKARNPYAVVLGHELTHYLKEKSKADYRQFALYAKDYITRVQGKDLSKLIAEKQKHMMGEIFYTVFQT